MQQETIIDIEKCGDALYYVEEHDVLWSSGSPSVIE